jgi:hypothetical protein
MRSLSLRIALLLAVACAMPALGELRTQSKVQPPAASTDRVAPRAVPRAIHNLRLADTLVLEDATSATSPKPTRIGVARAVAALQTAQAVAGILTWRTLADGHHVAALSVTSPGAAGVRLSMKPAPLPQGAVLRFYAPNDRAFEYPAQEIEGLLARNVYFGEDGPDAHVFWSPVVDADTIVLEVDLPPGADPADVRLALPQLSHLLERAQGVPTVACEGDATCRAVGRESNAIARVVFTDHGDSYACNGTLVADRDPGSFIPYFLTSQHCVDSQTVASTAQVYWFYQAAACGGATSSAFQTQARGAMLLRVVPATDTALLRLNAAPPAGATYAGWVIGDPAASLHNVTWQDSTAALHGADDCGAPSLAYYDGFDAAYNAGLYQWLGGTPQPSVP